VVRLDRHSDSEGSVSEKDQKAGAKFPPGEPREAHLRLAEIAQRANVSKRTVQRMLQDGKFPKARRAGSKATDPYEVPVTTVLGAGLDLTAHKVTKDTTPAPDEVTKLRAENTELRIVNARLEAERNGARGERDIALVALRMLEAGSAKPDQRRSFWKR